MVLCLVLVMSCIQVPGMPGILDAPDPIVGEWTGNQLPLVDSRLVFFLKTSPIFSRHTSMTTG